MKTRIRELLKSQYGEYDSHLEEVYEHKILETLNTKNKKKAEAWLTYNQVVLELKHNIKDHLKLRELQYRLTDSENPNRACLDVLSDIKKNSPELERLYYKIMNF